MAVKRSDWKGIGAEDGLQDRHKKQVQFAINAVLLIRTTGECFTCISHRADATGFTRLDKPFHWRGTVEVLGFGNLSLDAGNVGDVDKIVNQMLLFQSLSRCNQDKKVLEQ